MGAAASFEGFFLTTCYIEFNDTGKLGGLCSELKTFDFSIDFASFQDFCRKKARLNSGKKKDSMRMTCAFFLLLFNIDSA